jgi:hypothetical protein
VPRDWLPHRAEDQDLRDLPTDFANTLFRAGRRSRPFTASTQLRRLSTRDWTQHDSPTALWLYPGDYAGAPELVKQLLLYFDGGVATLAGATEKDDIALRCPWLGVPLAEAGLLHLVDGRSVSRARPNEPITASVPGQRADVLTACAVAGRHLGNGVQVRPVSRNQSAARLFASSQSERRGRPAGLAARRETSDKSRVVLSDLASVDLDLSRVPLNDIIAFREEHGRYFARYSADVRRFSLELLTLTPPELLSTLRERRAELIDRQDDLGRQGRHAFRVGGARLFSLMAGIAAIAEGAPVSAALSMASAAVAPPDETYAHHWTTYVLKARRELG